MKEFLANSVFFGIALTLGAYWLGTLLYKRYKSPFLNPLLTSSLLIVAVLMLAGLDYPSYEAGAKYISFFLTPATIALAVPAYKELKALKGHKWALLASASVGAASSMVLVLAGARFFGLSPMIIKSILAKSSTTAIALGLTQEAGGIPSLAIAATFLTGVSGAVFAEFILKMFRTKHSVARGIAIGTAAHVVGTAKAFELGRTEGAFASIAIVVAGLAAVVFMPFALMFLSY